MKNRFLLLASVLFLNTASNAQTAHPVPYINPAGYYSLDSKTTIQNGDTYGYFGTIKVKQVDSDKIFMEFYICKGAPEYTSGSFQDTMLYKNGIAIYTTSDDPSCVITFNFNSAGGITAEEETKDHDHGCGFDGAVVADGFYRRIISETPRRQQNK